MLQQMAKESGIETPTADDLVRIDRARKGKKLSNEEWISKTDPEAKIARMKDGRTRLAYKPRRSCFFCSIFFTSTARMSARGR